MLCSSNKKIKNNPCALAFLQALGVFVYCSLVGVLFWKGNVWFGKVPNYLGPLLFLILFVVSALISALIVFYQPCVLFLVENKKQEAIQLVISTTGWLFLFLLLLMISILIF